MSNAQKMKLSPVIANQGIIFDASASRAVGNGTILETTWDFDNGNKRTYKGAPVIEREIFATQGEYNVKLSFKTNDGQVFSKDLQLVIVDPAATIKTSTTTAFVGESVSFQAESYLTDIRNVEYIWQVQDEDGKRTVKSGNGLSFAHTFEKIGTYIITLTAKSPNGGIDSDSKIISVEAREPIATLDSPKPLNSEHPNTVVFDASRSYDPDSNSRSGLSYEWRINGQKVFLDNTSENGARGTMTFHSTGENTVSVTVSNTYGKIATASQSFVINSILSGDVTVSPQVAAINTPITFQANSKHAEFFEWNMGDGSPVQNGSNKSISHSYKNTGVYTVNVKLSHSDSDTVTTLTRKVYITDADSPYALIDISNSSNSAIEEPNMCNGNPAIVLNRADSTTLSASNSTNIDGRNTDLDYTWRYMGKVSTNQTITETFRDLGCFPIELTVRSKTNGAKHTTTQWIHLKNQAPQLTNISTTIDANKKDSNKVIVKATANGVMDPDGVITSYMWYYTTESDPEPQSVQITQHPNMTFVLPNVTEKYYFGVILEDNDGERINSMDLIQAKAPLLIDNANGNINMPLISLNAPNRVVKAGEKIKFSVDAKIVTGTNITNKSQYAWDFDGDGRIDERSNDPFIEHTYSQPGDYNMKVRVTHNGVSNTKYHTVVVRNELKASYLGYKIPGDKLYLMNTSQGVFDTAKWTLGTFTSHQSDGVVIDFDDLPSVNDKGSLGTLTVSNADTDISTTDILLKDITAVETPSEGNIALQTYPIITDNDTITIKDSSEVLRLSFYGNTATAYAIDVDMDMDSDLDGTSDNDVDNKSSPSYENGSVFTIADFAHSQKRHRKVKITLYNGSTPIASKTLNLVLDFIPDVAAGEVNAGETLGELSEFDQEKLDELATMIRALPDSERIIIMQKYNALVESWDNSFEKAKALIDLQVAIDSSTLEKSQRQTMTEVIDALLIGDAYTTDQVMIATKLIRDLIPPSSPNYDVLMEHIDAIESHPTNIAENKRI